MLFWYSLINLSRRSSMFTVFFNLKVIFYIKDRLSCNNFVFKYYLQSESITLAFTNNWNLGVLTMFSITFEVLHFYHRRCWRFLASRFLVSQFFGLARLEAMPDGSLKKSTCKLNVDNLSKSENIFVYLL